MSRLEIEKASLEQKVDDLTDELANANSRITEQEARLSSEDSEDGRNKDLMALERRNAELESFLRAANESKADAERELQKYKSQVR